MVVFVDLDDAAAAVTDTKHEGASSTFDMRDLIDVHSQSSCSMPPPPLINKDENDEKHQEKAEANPNLNGFSAALGCYPLVFLFFSFLFLPFLPPHKRPEKKRAFRI
jgi:hypothetical protein